MAPDDNPTSVVPLSDVVTVGRPVCLISRYQPVAAKIFGGGTSSVLTSGAGFFGLPEGAVLVSHLESGTSTNVF